MRLPEIIQNILSCLQEAGFSTFAVGGCMRDTLLGLDPKAWDLCTSATPAEMKGIFKDKNLQETSLKCGTPAVVMNYAPYDITIYSMDRSDTDPRHSAPAFYMDWLEVVLARDDFTINAMACGGDGLFHDPFDGRKDLLQKRIRCVANPEKHFEKDPLCILQALRFASVLDFTIHPETELAIRKMYPMLEQASIEKIRVEILNLLCGRGVGRLLREYTDIFTFLIPCLKPEVGYNQDNPHHLYTVWEHTIKTVENIPPDPELRMTMLLHDCGKPFTRTTDVHGIGHYKGHQEYSAELADDMLDRLQFNHASRDRIVRLVRAHDVILSTEKKILLQRLHKYGERDLRALFLIHCADRIATGTRNPVHAKEHCLELNDALDALLAENPCYNAEEINNSK